MQGHLWRQRTDDRIAEQLTDEPGTDYQPDCSPDGHSVVFVRYDGKSMELMLLDLASRIVRPLSANELARIAKHPAVLGTGPRASRPENDRASAGVSSSRTAAPAEYRTYYADGDRLAHGLGRVDHADIVSIGCFWNAIPRAPLSCLVVTVGL